MNLLSFASFILAALCVAKTALGYAPWTIPLGGAVFLPTFAAALAAGARRLALVCLGGVFLAGLVLAVALVAQSGSVEVIAGTVYPGGRRSIGAFVGLASLFGAPHLWILQASPALTGGWNQSELAGSYLVLGLASAVVALAVHWRAVAGRAPVLAAGGLLLVCLTWIVVDWPDAVGRRAVPLTLVPPERLAQALGVVAAIVFGLVLSAWADAPRLDRLPVALAAGSLTAVATTLGGRALREQAVPTLPWAAIVLVALVVGLAVAFAIHRPDRWLALATLPMLALLVVIAANPVQRGLGDLRSSPAVNVVVATGELVGDRVRWASDDPSFDALLMATGQPSLTGQQWVGPDDAAWRVLDPGRSARRAWNRGASFISIRWAPGEPTRIDALQKDVIRVRIDPCAPELKRLGLGLIVSRRRLEAPCLVLRRRIPWGYAERWVYGV